MAWMISSLIWTWIIKVLMIVSGLGIEPSFLNYALLPGIGLGIGNDNLLFLSTGLTYRITFEGVNENLRTV